MPDPKSESKEKAAKEILAYFLRNPKAADSLAGIARWRLLEETVRRSVQTTDAALKFLTERGYLRQVPLKGTESVFQFNAEKRRDAELFLKEKRRTKK